MMTPQPWAVELIGYIFNGAAVALCALVMLTILIRFLVFGYQDILNTWRRKQ